MPRFKLILLNSEEFHQNYQRHNYYPLFFLLSLCCVVEEFSEKVHFIISSILLPIIIFMISILECINYFSLLSFDGKKLIVFLDQFFIHQIF